VNRANTNDHDFLFNGQSVPLGAASIGQVHRAKLRTGEEVVIKIQYPNVKELFKTDIATIKAFCRLAQPVHLPMLDEIEKQFMTEFDYRSEVRLSSFLFITTLEMTQYCIKGNTSRERSQKLKVTLP